MNGKWIVCAILILLVAAPLKVIAGSTSLEGGTLHGAFVGEWNMAPYTNKLATAADWIITRPRIKDKAYYSRIIQNLRPYAFELVQCVNQSTADEGFDSSMSVAELATSCMILKGW